jgi:6-pyruvoyltetrahydropterin/6-carboxytetrahydropterin synthase
MVYLTRRLTFNAAHKLWVDDWSREKNLEIFGKCANPNWHGHNYQLFITVKGRPDPVRGYVMDAKDLKKLAEAVVVDKLDHSNLNLDVDFIPKGMQPTTENLVILIWQQLEPKIIERGCKLHCIKLEETENISCEYYGEAFD